MSSDNGAQLLTARQLAQRWQVAPAQVYRLHRAKRLPGVQLGRYVRFRADQIEEFERAGGVSADE